MPTNPVEEMIAQCTRFLRGHYPRSVREQLQEIAESPLALTPRDHYGRGGVVAGFESELATLLGKESAVFMPSGTMAQQIALRIWAGQAGNPRVAFHPTCHLEIHEHGAYRELHHLESVLLGEADRLFTLADLEKTPDCSSLFIELPQREIGGQLPSWSELSEICDRARARGMKLHMDGARLWECSPFYGRRYAEIAAPFDSVYVSFYKILGGLPGALLAGPAEMIREARIWQRRHGGNLAQMAPAVISAKLGMERHLPRMGDYVAKAREMAAVLRGFGVRVVPDEPPTNMMHVYFSGDPARLVAAAEQIGREDRVFLFSGLGDDGKLELVVGEAALDLSREELERLFGKLLG
ncbi:MAG TPA: beta-eliminating lyase-related protein [Fimbriimonadaceae bacterium]|nr:beta-eliminating lyase-related protein [Fimbriimonadaceae bacterium]